MRQRRRLINAQHGRLAEFGLVAPKGPAGLKRLENALEDGAADLPGPVREAGAIRLAQIADLTEMIERPAAELEAATKTDDELRRSCTIPGIGPATAGAVAALAPDLDAFDRGRTVAAWPGSAPRQGSTGGKAKRGAVGKMGRTDIERLLIVGASCRRRASGVTRVVRRVVRKGGGPNSWLAALVAGKPKMVAAVAPANKMARMIRAVTTKREEYRMA